MKIVINRLKELLHIKLISSKVTLVVSQPMVNPFSISHKMDGPILIKDPKILSPQAPQIKTVTVTIQKEIPTTFMDPMERTKYMPLMDLQAMMSTDHMKVKTLMEHTILLATSMALMEKLMLPTTKKALMALMVMSMVPMKLLAISMPPKEIIMLLMDLMVTFMAHMEATMVPTTKMALMALMEMSMVPMELVAIFMAPMEIPMVPMLLVAMPMALMEISMVPMELVAIFMAPMEIAMHPMDKMVSMLTHLLQEWMSMDHMAIEELMQI